MAATHQEVGGAINALQTNPNYSNNERGDTYRDTGASPKNENAEGAPFKGAKNASAAKSKMKK